MCDDFLLFPSDQLTDYLSNLSIPEKIELQSFYFNHRSSYVDSIKGKYQKMKQPLLSIITSVYQGREYLKGFLDNTIAWQGFELFELILVDCNQSDEDYKIIKPYLKDFSNILYIKVAYDQGMYNAWNLAIEKSRSDFLTNANIDDRRSPMHALTLLDVLDGQGLDIISSLFWTVKKLPENQIDNADIWYINAHDSPRFEDLVKDIDYLEEIPCYFGPMPIWRKSLHQKGRIFDETMFGGSADLAFWMRSLKDDAQFGFYKIPLGFYLNRKNSYGKLKRARTKLSDI